MTTRVTAMTFPPAGCGGWWTGASWRERRELLLATALATVATLAAPALLALSGYLLARAAEAPPILTLAAAIVGVRLFALVRAAGRYGERIVSHDLALRRLGRDRVTVYSRLIPMVPGRIGSRTSTDVLDRLVADTDRMQDLTVRVMVPGLALAISTAAAVAVTAAILPAAAVALAIVLTVHILALAWIERRGGVRLARRQAGAREQLTRELVTVLDAAPELVAWGADVHQAQRTSRRGKVLDGLVRRAAAVTSAGGGISIILAGLATLAVLLVAARAGAAGELAPSLVPALALLALGISEAIAGLSDVLTARNEVTVAGARLASLLEDAPARTTARAAAPVDARLAVRDVRVIRDGRALLDGVDLQIAPGERVAVMGPSGAGKSTLGDVVVGLVHPDGGSAQLGGTDIAAIDDDVRHDVVCWVPQDPHIFPTTLAGNLRIAAPAATDTELEQALRAVGGGSWLDGLPDGLLTLLGEHGERCSGGERQRVGLARGVLSRSPLVVLDEPASHLPYGDALTALGAVLDAVPQRGALLITHRAEEAELADRVVTLTTGRT